MSGATPLPFPSSPRYVSLGVAYIPFLTRRPNDFKSSNSVPEQDPFYRLSLPGNGGEPVQGRQQVGKKVRCVHSFLGSAGHTEPTDRPPATDYFTSPAAVLHTCQAGFSGERELIRLMFDDQTDSRIIIPTYLPTSFRLFRPGSVSTKEEIIVGVSFPSRVKVTSEKKY